MIKHYLTIAFRGLHRYKLQNIFCILGLTVGFSAFVFGTYWWYWENHFDDFHPDAGRTYAITTRGLSKLSDGSDLELNQVHRDDVAAFLQTLPEIENYTFVNNSGYIEYKKDDVQEKIWGIDVDSSFFSVFYSEFIDGDYKNIAFDKSHIVLTETVAMKIFGKTDCTGELFLTANGSKTIAGVIKDYPSNSDFRMEYLYLNNSPYNSLARTSFYVKLHRTADVNAVRKKVEEHKSVAQIPEWQGNTKDWSFNLRSLQENHFYCKPELKGRFLNIRLLGFAGLLALVCALMNALVLFIGQQQRKRSKNKTFKSMGASNRYLFGKSFVDLCCPVIIALLLTAMVVSALFPLYQKYTELEGYGIYENYFNRIALKDLIVYSFRWITVLLAAFLTLSSLLIVLIISKNSIRSLVWLRNMLIVLQIFIGCFFFFISLSLYKQVAFTQNKDKGIDVKNITQIDIGYYTKTDFHTLGEELLRSPHIDDVTFTTTPILSQLGDWYLSYISSRLFFKENPDEKLKVNVFIVEPNFIDFFGIKIKEGKWLSGKDEFVINEAQMQEFKGKNPLQNPIQAGEREMTVCGVIRDYCYSTMQYQVKSLVFHLQQDEIPIPYQYIYIKTKPENHDKAIQYVKSVLETVETGEVAPGRQILNVQDIQDEFNRPEKTLFRIFGFLSLICILVVSFGIYSLVTLTIEQRKKEIAIRKINGAEVRDILVLFIRNYLLLVVIGNMLSLPVAYYFVVRWLENYAYRTALSWWLFAVVFVATCLIVLLSIVEKVRIAAAENPAEIVNGE